MVCAVIHKWNTVDLYNLVLRCLFNILMDITNVIVLCMKGTDYSLYSTMGVSDQHCGAY